MGGIIEPTRSIGDFDVKDRLPPRALSIEPEIGVYSLSSLFAAATQQGPQLAGHPASTVSSNCGILLLATDGVWDFVGPTDVVKCVQQIKPLWRAVEAAAKKEMEAQQQQQQLLLQQQAQQQQKSTVTSVSRRVASAHDFGSLIRSSLGSHSSSTNKLCQQQPPAATQGRQPAPSQHQHAGSAGHGLKRISSWRRLLHTQPPKTGNPQVPLNSLFHSTAQPAFFSNPEASSPHQGGMQQQLQRQDHTASPRATPPLASQEGIKGSQAPLLEAPTSQMMSELCRLIVKKALKKGSTDDCTCLAAFIFPVASGAAAQGECSDLFWSSSL